MNKAVFFDRDGVINARTMGGYIKDWERFRILPNTGELLAKVKSLGYLAIIITNQRGVGVGFMSEAELQAIHEKMQEHFQTNFGVRFDDIFAATDADRDSIRRKPNPTMLLEAQSKWNIDMANSWMIGDTETDIAAGISAGVKTAFLHNHNEIPSKNATILLENVLDIVDYL
jgi:D-glycero-D-manno-heptose 1,7-bisphosphate phosphatase